MPTSRDSSRRVMAARELLARRQARRSTLPFTRYTFPGEFQVNWHHQGLGRKLDAFVSGQIKRLMIFMPPRSGKSEMGSRRLPAYILGHYPDDEVMVCSYSADLAGRMNRDCQRIIDSPAYARLFPEVRLPNAKTRGGGVGGSVRNSDLFEIAGRRGAYRSAGVGGGITGMGFKWGIIDDPIKNREEADSPVIRAKVWEWYTDSFFTRQAPDARILLICTRWHDDDLAGRLLKLQKADASADRWEVFSIPAFATDNPCADDPRKPGEPLWPERQIFTTEHLNKIRATLGSRSFAALYGQSPISEGGNYFREQWFGQWRDAGPTQWMVGNRLVNKGDCTIFAEVDPAATEHEASDYTGIGVFAATPHNDLLILDMVRERLGVERILPRLAEVHRQWNLQFAGFELVAFQAALVHAARQRTDLPPIRERPTHGKSKLARATPAIIKAEAGQIFVPWDPACEWRTPFFDEITKFTGIEDAHDDQVDVLAQSVTEMTYFGLGGVSDSVGGQTADELNRYPDSRDDGMDEDRQLFGI